MPKHYLITALLTMAWAAGASYALCAQGGQGRSNGSGSRAGKAGADGVPVRLAILDLTSPARTPWLGAAIAESLIAKLSDLEGMMVMERQRVQNLLLAAGGEKPAPRLLGVDYLLTGSVQLAGKWPQAQARLRVSTKLVGAQTAKITAGPALILDGTVKDFFSLESQLAGRLAEILGRKASLQQLDYQEQRTPLAVQLFGQGILALDEAKRLLGPTVTGAGISAAARAEAGGRLRAAADLLRRAQRANAGAFFARAHRYEALAYELLARCQTDTRAASTIRQQTVTRFRQDAAQAAPAFYDLGGALQANGEYTAAVDAYRQYLNWIDQRGKTVVWRLPCERISNTKNWRSNAFALVGKDIITLAGGRTLICADASSGERHWTRTLWTRTRPRPSRRRSPLCWAATATVVAVCHNARQVLVLDRRTGKDIRTLMLAAQEVEALRLRKNAVLHAALTSDARLLVLHAFSICIEQKIIPDLFLGIRISDGQVVWRRTNLSMEAEATGFLQEGDRLLFAGIPNRFGSYEAYRLLALEMETGKVKVICSRKGILPSPWARNRMCSLPDGRMVVGAAYWYINTDCKDLAITCDRRRATLSVDPKLPRFRFAVSPDHPRRWWLIRPPRTTSQIAVRRLELRNGAQGRLLWTYRAANDIGLIIPLRDRLLAQVGAEVLCLSPPGNSGIPKDQHRAWMHIGSCLAALKQMERAVDAFHHAERIQSGDPEIYWAWARTLAGKPEWAKLRLRLLDMFLLNASPRDPRLAAALACMRQIAGLRYIMNGTPLWDGCFFCSGSPYLVPIRGYRPCRLPRNSLAAYDIASGKILWSKPFVPQFSIPTQTNIEGTFLQRKDRFVCYFRGKSPWGPDRDKRLVLGDAKNGKILAAVKPGAWITREESYTVLHRYLMPLAIMPISPEGMLQRDPAHPRRTEFLDLASGKVRWQRELLHTGEEFIAIQLLPDLACFILRTGGKPKQQGVRALALAANDGHTLWQREDWPQGTEFSPPSTAAAFIRQSDRMLVKSKHSLLWLGVHSGRVHRITSCNADDGGFIRMPDGRLALKVKGVWHHLLANGELGPKLYTNILCGVIQPQTSVNGKSYRICSPSLKTLGLVQSPAGNVVARFRFFRPTRRCYILFWFHDPRTDNVLVYENMTRATYVFERKKLVRFLLLPENKTYSDIRRSRAWERMRPQP